jgi:hypothetical protein
MQENKAHYRTLTKTRKYVNVDGQLVTSQTSTVVLTGEENKKQKEHEIWYVHRDYFKTSVMRCVASWNCCMDTYLNVSFSACVTVASSISSRSLRIQRLLQRARMLLTLTLV